MVKNMKEDTNENSDTLAAIGIGAMIVFIALILVAAVAAAVIIQTAEKLQQNAQTTGSETTDMLSSKIIIMNIIIPPAPNALYITFELAPGSSNLLSANIDWSIICPAGADYGTFSPGTTGVGNGIPQILLTTGTTYDIPLTQANLGNCQPVANQAHTLLIQSIAGGFTYETLNYGTDISSGALVI
jgi:flagellin FlaB